MCGRFHAPVALSPGERASLFRQIGSWLDPRVDMGTEEAKRKCSLCWKSKCSWPSRTQSL